MHSAALRLARRQAPFSSLGLLEVVCAACYSCPNGCVKIHKYGLFAFMLISVGPLLALFSQVVRHHLGPDSDVYKHLGPETGEMVRNMTAGAASSTVMQCFTVPLDIVGQARWRYSVR